MKALACPMLAYEYANTWEKTSSPARSDVSRDEAVPSGNSQFWYNIGFGFGLAFSLTPNGRDGRKG
ncbi:MAG: hypothetical protein ACYC9O_14280 [Candidatus Latescibacterota bacterium]